MLMSATQWNLRLENEYRAMCAFPINSLFSWKAAPGQRTPRVKAYIVTYNIKTPIKDGHRFEAQEHTDVLITMSDSPGGAPTAKIVGGDVPFLPNLYINGNFCLGDLWCKEPILWKLVINIGRVLAMDPERTNPNSPANGTAATDWTNKRSGIHKFSQYKKVKFPHPVGY